MATIRDYRDTDWPQLEVLMAELQDYERGVEPDHRPAADAKNIPAYIDFLFQQMAGYEGRMFVAEDEQGIAGFVCVTIKRSIFMVESGFECHGFVTDLTVSETRRGGGIGKALMYAAEEYARVKGADRMKLSALARNPGAMRFYDREGYRQYEVTYVKEL